MRQLPVAKIVDITEGAAEPRAVWRECKLAFNPVAGMPMKYAGWDTLVRHRHPLSIYVITIEGKRVFSVIDKENVIL